MRNGVTTAYHWLALLIAVGIVVQVFLAGLGIFGAESFDAHEGFGWMIHTAAILLFILALIGPRTGRAIGMSFGLLALMTVQILLVGARDDTPWVAAFHPDARPVRARARDPHRDAGDQPTTGSVRSSSSALSASCISPVMSS